MHIGLIAPPWLPVPPRGYGGTEAVIDGLARGFADEGHAVTLFTTGDSTCPVPTAWVYDQGQDPGVGSSAVEMRHVIAAYEALAGVDIVSDHTALGPVHAISRPLPPVVATHHNRFTPEYIDLFRVASERVHVVAISRAQAAEAEGVRIARVIHHGVDVEAFPFGSGSGGYLCFLGRMSPDKGAHRAIAAAREAGLPLRIAAKMREPSELAYFDGEIRPRLGSDVEFIGEVDAATKVELLAGAVALVNPIRWPEPFGLVMVEALACGTPVLALTAGAAPEIVDHGITGYLCADEHDLARRAAHVQRLDRAACRAAALERFSARRMAADHLALYDDVVEGRLAGRSLAS